ncbi:MAG: beta-galactosidase [Bifidobacteriaceae bacterium]|jgi:beta-galactosidase/beta-glucuronidase|nr:beta-galactosidase [Bifidobacteriaceae bacterium]
MEKDNLNQFATIPRPEYPRPQLSRDEWLNLNGTWEFEFDPGDSGFERGLVNKKKLDNSIIVPFVPESELSGIGNTDFHEAVWYHRSVQVPEAWSSQRLILHFGAVDHDATVWVNGTEVTRHRGGFTSFSADITDAVAGKAEFSLTVRARDSKKDFQARGKQATEYENSSVFYTRSTGIWQTVWLEPVGEVYIQQLKVTPDVGRNAFNVVARLTGNSSAYRLSASLKNTEGIVLSQADAELGKDLNPSVTLKVPVDEVHLWEPGNPYLYPIEFIISDREGKAIDTVNSYAGLRSISIEGTSVKVNGKPLFQRLVLDQGYWPESLMTAPSDEALVKDIKLSMQAGFNGARMHQKVFEERYIYHADRLGYLVWGEFGDWGVSTGAGPKGNNQHPTASFITQWIEAVERDYSHPAIVGWCPLNETYQKLTDQITQLDDITHGMFAATKAIDASRPVLDASGYSHRVSDSDIYDSHLYEQNPEKFEELVGKDAEKMYENDLDGDQISVHYKGQPYFVSEYGGIWWNAEKAAIASGKDQEHSWGYGERVTTIEEFYERFEKLTEVLVSNPKMFGYCYTELTDVFQEENGIFSFDRTPKFDIDRIREIQEGLVKKYR